MVICRECKKILFLVDRQYLGDGTAMCRPCYEKWEERKRQEHLDNQAHYYLDSRNYKILQNFIEKYGLEPKDEEVEKLEKLLEKKFNKEINENDFPDVLKYIKGIIDENRELRRFENDLIYHKERNFFCSVCKQTITRKQFDYSIDVFNKALCFKHQREAKATLHAKKLYNALQERGINCELEAYDGHKHVDISIPEAKIYVEIDGEQHKTDAKQLDSDLKRDKYSHKEGFETIRYTNKQINEKLDEIADALTKVAKQRK